MYSRLPTEVKDGIPFFSRTDSYVENYDRIAKDHLGHFDSSGANPFMTDEQVSESNRETREAIRHHVAAGSRILDAGVGMGSLFAPLDEFKRYGVDVAFSYLQRALESGIRVAMCRIEELPYFDDYFDAVVCTDVLEHVFHLDRATEELIRVLKPDGILIVRTPNEEFLGSYINTDQVYGHSHVRSFSIESLRLHLETCFDLEYVEHRYAGYAFTIADQIRYPQIRLGDPVRNTLDKIRRLADESEHAQMLKPLPRLLHSSLEEIVDALLCLQTNYVEIYRELAPGFLRAQELIGVFKKA